VEGELGVVAAGGAVVTGAVGRGGGLGYVVGAGGVRTGAGGVDVGGGGEGTALHEGEDGDVGVVGEAGGYGASVTGGDGEEELLLGVGGAAVGP
jgi:hypothetical protein